MRRRSTVFGMEILLLTIFLSLVLAAGFTASFVHTVIRADGRSLEQQSLQPLDDEDSPSPF